MGIWLTGEQLTEKFFIFAGYSQTAGSWGRLEGPIFLTCGDGSFPPLHTSLDLQEEWLWPELHKVGIDYAHFVYECDNKNIICRMCKMVGGESQKAKMMYGNLSQTKALAQLEAALKALGIII